MAIFIILLYWAIDAVSQFIHLLVPDWMVLPLSVQLSFLSSISMIMFLLSSAVALDQWLCHWPLKWKVRPNLKLAAFFPSGLGGKYD